MKKKIISILGLILVSNIAFAGITAEFETFIDKKVEVYLMNYEKVITGIFRDYDKATYFIILEGEKKEKIFIHGMAVACIKEIK